MQEKKTIIPKEFWLPVSFVTVLLAIAVSYGMMKQGQIGMKEDITEMKEDFKQQMTYLNEKLDRFIESDLVTSRDVTIMLENN